MKTKSFSREAVETDEELDARFNRTKVLPRGTFTPPKGATKPENCKVKISMYIDADILQYFRARAESLDAAPYQTQINNELRRVMEADSNGEAKLDSSILDDTEFLRALKEKLETV